MSKRILAKQFIFSHFVKILVFCSIIFFTPFNLFYKISLEHAYVHGLLVDYLIPKIYLSDFFIVAFILMSGVDWQKKKKPYKKNKANLSSYLQKKTQYILLPIIFLLSTLLSKNAEAAMYSLCKFLEFGLLGLAVFSQRKLLLSSSALQKIALTLIFTVLFQSLLGIYQFGTQHALFSYAVFGETNLQNFANVTKANFAGQERVLPYGTTAHPNIFAGMVVVYSMAAIVLLRHFLPKLSRLKKHPFLSPWKKISLFGMVSSPFIVLAVSLSQSLSAWVSLFLGLGILFFTKFIKKHISLLFVAAILLFVLSPLALHSLTQVWPKNTSLNRRDLLNSAAWNMFLSHPLNGVGINNFTEYVELYSESREVVRFVQPAHHLGLLWLAETGIVGIAFLFILLQFFWETSLKIVEKSDLLLGVFVLLPLASLDHYLFTQQIGLFLILSVFFFIFFSKKFSMTENSN